MKTITYYKKAVVLILFSLFLLQGNAQRLDYKVNSETTIYLKAVYNTDNNHSIVVIIDNHNYGRIVAGGSLAINKVCHKHVKIANLSGEKILWKTGDTAEEWNNKIKKEQHSEDSEKIEHTIKKKNPSNIKRKSKNVSI